MMSPFSKRLTVPLITSLTPVAVQGVHVVALRLAHLLEDDLLGGLRRDAAENVGRLGKLDLHVDFRLVAVQLLRFGKRDFRQGIGYLLDDLAHREQLDLTRLVIELRPQVLGRLVVLARGGQHGVLYGRDDDIGLDALFPWPAPRSSVAAGCSSPVFSRASSPSRDDFTSPLPVGLVSPAPTGCGGRDDRRSPQRVLQSPAARPRPVPCPSPRRPRSARR